MGHHSENLKSVQSLSFQEQTFRGLYFGNTLPSSLEVIDPLSIPKSSRQLYKNTYRVKKLEDSPGLFNWALESGAPLAEDIEDLNLRIINVIIHFDPSKDINIKNKYNRYVHEVLKTKISYKFTSFCIDDSVRKPLPTIKYKTYKYYKYTGKDDAHESLIKLGDIIISEHPYPSNIWVGKQVKYIDTTVGILSPIVAFAIPSGGGKTSMTKTIQGSVDVDDLVPNSEELKKLRRTSLDSGNWEEYLKIYNKILITSWNNLKIRPTIVFMHNKYTAKILNIHYVFEVKLHLEHHKHNVEKRDPLIYNSKLVESSWNTVDTQNVMDSHFDMLDFVSRNFNNVVSKYRMRKSFYQLRKAIDDGIQSDNIVFIRVYQGTESLLSSHGNTVSSMNIINNYGIDVSLKIHTNEFARYLKMSNQQWKYYTRSKPAYITARLFSRNVTYTKTFDGYIDEVYINESIIDVSGHIIQALIAMAFPDFSFFGSPNIYPDYHSFFSNFIINQTNVTNSIEPTFLFPAYHSWIETYIGVMGAISGISLLLKRGVKTHKKHILMFLIHSRKLIKSIKITGRTMIGVKKNTDRQFIEISKI